MPIDFDDLTKRILDNLDGLNDKIDDLCSRITKVEIHLDNHFKEIELTRINKDRKFYVIVALMGVGFTIFEIIRGLHSA